MVETVREETDDHVGADVGREYIEKMIENDNRVMRNPFGQPVIEIVAPRDMEEEIDELIDEWDINPRGHGVIAQSPSFAEEKPEVCRDLRSWQFLLQDDDFTELDSCGFDLEEILDELADEPVLLTKAPKVKASLPF